MILVRSLALTSLFAVTFGCSQKANDPGGNPTGGAGGSTGGNPTGGSSGSAGTATGGSSGGDPGTCTITPASSTSTRIPTVGIVTFTTGVAGITAARVEFGPDTSYGMTAPVDVASGGDFRTLLLGMKPSSTYHYRVVVTGSSGACTGGDNTITTGARANGLPTLDITTANAQALSGGFLVTGQYEGSGDQDAPAYIVDADGEIVWWYVTGQRNVTGVRMSYDGKHMWINAANVPESMGAEVHRVSMDGMTDEDLSSQFTGQNHQLAVLPDETVLFYAYSPNGCDDIKERSPDGTVRTIVNSNIHGAGGPCHVNAIEYSPEDDAIVYSDLDNNNYTKVRRSDGRLVWVLGGSTSDFPGSAAMWQRQHGIDALGLDRFVFFNNGAMAGGGGGSLAIEILLDLGAMTATRPWTYTATPTIANQVMGDVQRMPNGNTIVAYSTQGVVHEVDSDGLLLQELNWPLGGAFGYIEKRSSLYGPPPR